MCLKHAQVRLTGKERVCFFASRGWILLQGKQRPLSLLVKEKSFVKMHSCPVQPHKAESANKFVEVNLEVPEQFNSVSEFLREVLHTQNGISRALLDQTKGSSGLFSL